MLRSEFFGLRINQGEREMIARLAQRLQRTQSDAVRLLVREAASVLLQDDEARSGGPADSEGVSLRCGQA